MDIGLDDDAIASALNLEDFILEDLRKPQESIVLAQLVSARRAAIEATRRLIEANPQDPAGIMAAQNDVRRLKNLHVWLLNSLTAAREAWAQLPQEEREAVLAFTKPQEINDA